MGDRVLLDPRAYVVTAIHGVSVQLGPTFRVPKSMVVVIEDES